MSVNQELKNPIKEIKYRKRTKQDEVAVMLGINKTYLSDMINGRVPFTDNIRTKIYELLSDDVGDKNSLSLSNNSGTITQSIDRSRGGGNHTHNTTNNYNSCNPAESGTDNLATALAEIAEQRKLTEKALAQVEKLIEMLAHKG